MFALWKAHERFPQMRRKVKIDEAEKNYIRKVFTFIALPNRTLSNGRKHILLSGEIFIDIYGKTF